MIFPCFDQPDLMARLQLSCQTEPDWTVIANDIENESEASMEEKAELERECRLASCFFAGFVETEPAPAKK